MIESSNPPQRYQIRVEGHLSPHWANDFDGFTLTHDANGETLLTGAVIDQTDLHRVLRKVRDLGLSLVSAVRL